MFLPLHDGVPLAHLKAPLVTRALIGANVAAFALVALGVLPIGEQWIVAGFGVVPAVLFGTEALPDGLPFVPTQLTLLTSLFLHGSALHPLGNMLFLWVFGDNVEDGMGHGRFLVFYLVCGVCAGLAHAFMDPESTRPFGRGRGRRRRLLDPLSAGEGLGPILRPHPAAGAGDVGDRLLDRAPGRLGIPRRR